MIVAAGLTPAWQQILVFESLEFGEVNRAREAYWSASGTVINVGLALHFLGGPTRTLSLLGGTSGRSIEEEFTTLGVDCRWIRTRNRTRVCTTLLDRATGRTTELVENAPSILRDEIDAYQRTYEAGARGSSIVVLSGSLPPGTPESFYRNLLDLTPPGARAVVDARGPELVEALRSRPFLVKPNRAELAWTLGRELDTEADIIEAMDDLHSRGAECVLITDGKKPFLFSHAGNFFRIHPLEVNTVNPIGCGDCLAAGIAWALFRGMGVIEAARFGTAAAAENARMMLPSRLNAELIQNAMQDVRVETVAPQAEQELEAKGKAKRGGAESSAKRRKETRPEPR